MASPPVSPSPSDDPTVRAVPTPVPAEETTVRTAPPTVLTQRPALVTAGVVLWWVALALGVVAQLVVAAGGGVSLWSSAPAESARIFLLVVVAVVASLLPMAHWLVLTWATLRLRRGRGRPRPVLSVLAVLSLLSDGFAVVTIGRSLPIVLCVVHAAVVVAATVTMWLPAVSTWLTGPVALVPASGTAAPAGLTAVPVPAERAPRRANPLMTTGIVVGALVALVGHAVLAIGGSARVSLEQDITTGMEQQGVPPSAPARCPWGAGWDLALGGTGTATCTVEVRDATYPVDVRSGADGASWRLRR